MSKIRRVVKSSMNILLNILGLEIRKKQPIVKFQDTIPPLFDDPFEALHYVRGGEQAAFKCPIYRIVDFKGLSFHNNKWHPFVALIQEQIIANQSYTNSILNKYYSIHQPRHAGESILGFDKYPRIFVDLEPHMYHLYPWSSRSPDKIDKIVKRWSELDNIEHGGRDLKLHFHGYQLHGPVSKDKLQLEINRLQWIAECIRNNGYDRSYGDVGTRMLRRNNEYIFIADGGGYHRTAAMAALGYEWIPARFYPGPVITDIKDVDYWPQVRRGVWGRKEAIAYFNHLFDFDSQQWAIDQNLFFQ